MSRNMKDNLWCIVYLPALFFWIGFVLTWKFTNYLSDDTRFMRWQWKGIKAIDSQIYAKFGEL